jgi:hypothetical protein
VIVTPQSISSSPPFLFLGFKPISKMQYQNTFTTTKQQSSRKSRWIFICMVHRRSSCITLKKHSYPPGLSDDFHEWAKKWLKLGYNFESAKAKTVMNRIIAKYEPFTPPLPNTIYRSLGDHLPPSPISYWDIASQIRCTLSNPKLQPMQPGSLQNNFTPSVLSASMVYSAGVIGGKTHRHLSQRFKNTGITCVQ